MCIFIIQKFECVISASCLLKTKKVYAGNDVYLSPTGARAWVACLVATNSRIQLKYSLNKPLRHKLPHVSTLDTVIYSDKYLLLHF